MNSTWELKEKSTGELKVTIEGEAWETAKKKALNKIAKNANIPGFRKGKVPTAMIKKQFGEKAILAEAADACANEAFQTAIKEHNIVLVDRATMDIETLEADKIVYVFTCTVKPEVKLGEYKNLAVSKNVAEVTDADVDAEVAKLAEKKAELVLKEEGTVANGDTAVIDFEGFKDGIPFEGGKGENYPLVIGSGAFIPGFEEQVLGMGIEETKDLNVTFPENYGAAELAGQPVVFKVTVHEIKTKVLPELNDELVKGAEIEGVETVEAYREYTKNNLVNKAEAEADRNFENDILTAVCEAAEIEIPEAMIKDETDRLVNDFAQRLAQQGFSLEQFMQMTGQTEENVRAEMRLDAESKVKVTLVLEAIAKAENLEASEEDLNNEYAKLASMYGMEVENIKMYISADMLADDIKNRKALDFIKENVAK
ncbi:MAG: trigger factor [Longicatena sp.]|nr:trigger factor [Longicatena sp.]